jgi:hypothetical protein
LNSVIQSIAARRQKLLDGLTANDGDINLKIFEDFYPDEAHFIYELLQNAEDAGATEASFELFPDHCAFEHNGTRHFDERDVRAITGIFNSSKKENSDKIGKFGVGFKSVFVYTETPSVYSQDFSFRILNLVLPEEIPSKSLSSAKTRFEFPFNNPKKPAATAYSEIEAGLQKLSETTLLYLHNLRSISWRAGSKEGAVLRDEHSDTHIEVLKLVHGKEVLSSHWLRFTQPAHGAERQNVAVAFELTPTGKAFDSTKPLESQFKITPAAKGTVSVFFPAEKETSGLRFHLHAPFVPELSRASIKNSPQNAPLFEQLARLVADCLHNVRDLGLLTGEFLAVLPNEDDALPERYRCIRTAVLQEMQTKPLVPMHGGGHAPGSQLLQGRAALKALLTPEDLALMTGREDAPKWAIGATQRNSNQDRLLASLKISAWVEEDVKSFFESRARESENYWDACELDEDVQLWLKAKPRDWMQALYAILLRHCEETSDYGHLAEVVFVPLTSGELSTGNAAYFLSESGELADLLPYVDPEILSAGSKKGQQDEAKRFLEKLGVRQPNETDEMVLLLNTRYGETGEEPSAREYIRDLRRMISFWERSPNQAQLFFKRHVFKVDAPEFTWATLKVFHELLPEGERRWPLSRWYLSSEVNQEKLVKFATAVGCQADLSGWYEKVSCYANPNWQYLSTAPGGRWGNGFNRDFALSAVAKALLRSKRAEAVLLIWKALCSAEVSSPSILKAAYQVTERGGPRYADSQLVCSLRELAWVPQIDGTFVKPSAAVPDKLPQGFTYDAGYRWLAAVGFASDEKARAAETSVRAARRAELGFSSEDELERARAFVKLPEEEQRRILDDVRRGSEEVELPERPIRNPELRKGRVARTAAETPDKETEIKRRSVQLGASEAKQQAKLYLQDQYTNTQGQMICQACRRELPFKLPNGAYYFEAVEIVRDADKRYREGYLALCPNHAAAYMYANAQSDEMSDVIATAVGAEVEVTLGGTETLLYFTETHLADARACLSSELESSERQ